MPQSAVTAARPPSVTTRISGQPGPVERSSWHSDRTCGRSRRPSTRMTSAPGVSTRAGPSAGATRTLCSSRPSAGSTSVEGCSALVSSRSELMTDHLPGSDGARFAGPSRRFLLGPVEDVRGTASYVLPGAPAVPAPWGPHGYHCSRFVQRAESTKGPGGNVARILSPSRIAHPPVGGRGIYDIASCGFCHARPPRMPRFHRIGGPPGGDPAPPGRTRGALVHAGADGRRGHHGGRR